MRAAVEWRPAERQHADDVMTPIQIIPDDDVIHVTGAHPPVTREQTAGDIRWTLDGASPWPASRPVVTLALDALPIVEDDLARDVITRMATTIADLGAELRAVREVLSEAMTYATAQQRQAMHARQRLAERLHDERRTR